MAETLLFNIPDPGQNQDIPYLIHWYQSINGFDWGSPVDTIVISNLQKDTATGKYIWTSDRADPTKYHLLKTASINGVESSSGVVLPPRPQAVIPTTPSDLFAERIDTGDAVYSIGETIELMLEVEDSVVGFIGQTINVFIVDKFGNTITEVMANRVGSSLYAASWRIPKSLPKLYNIKKEVDVLDEYFLTDIWILPGNTSVKFDFRVSKAPTEQPVTENSLITLKFSNIEALSSDLMFDDVEVSFSTKLTPYYATVQDVRGQNKEFLEDFTDYEIANEIMVYSQEVDLTLRPNRIRRQAVYDYAVSQWVSYSSAYSLISAGQFNNLTEDKEIDTFKVSVTRNEKGNVLRHMLDYIANFEQIILAGGEDNPVKSVTFVKGIFDPNRTNIARASLDTSDMLPYVNKTTKSFAITDQNGDTYEIRGTHTIGYLGYGGRYALGNTFDPYGGSNFTPAETNFQEAWEHD